MDLLLKWTIIVFVCKMTLFWVLQRSLQINTLFSELKYFESECLMTLTKQLESVFILKVCHGDIKSENVMITGWNWVLLTDFASFKPTYLPEVRNVCQICFIIIDTAKIDIYILHSTHIHTTLKKIKLVFLLHNIFFNSNFHLK